MSLSRALPRALSRALRRPLRDGWRALRDPRAATAVEYGLILSLVFLAIIAAVNQVASGTLELWTSVSTKVVSASQR